MRKPLHIWEKRIEAQLNERGYTISNMPESYSPEDRAWVKEQISESGMLTLDYIGRLRAIISIMERALQASNSRVGALLDIVRKSQSNCSHCMHERTPDMSDRCIDVDFECMICREAGCPCRDCMDGSNFVWHIVPGAKVTQKGFAKPMQEPVELYPGKYLPLEGLTNMLPIYIEHRFTCEIVGGLYDPKMDMFCFTSEGGGDWLDNEGQGVTWRAWMGYPTRRERDVAPWKKLPDEGFTEEELHENG